MPRKAEEKRSGGGSGGGVSLREAGLTAARSFSSVLMAAVSACSHRSLS